ncbi:MAG: sigma-70 family RNA polymerase sigma factor [Gemmataceae bacterium]|nr:sigma-70 family RNA polymerase sigma factor [Gemmataceae bacterium]
MASDDIHVGGVRGMNPGSGNTSASLLGRLGLNPNDPAAWHEFVERYGPRILQWCRHWKLQEADADDVTQIVLINVARQMRSFRYDPAKSFRGWLKTVAHAAWCDWLETQKRPGKGSGDTEMLKMLGSLEARDDLAQKLEAQYDAELLQIALAQVQLRVQPHTWEAFRLMTFEGLPGAEVAARLDMKVGTVFVAKSKVQKMVQEQVRAMEELEARPTRQPGQADHVK